MTRRIVMFNRVSTEGQFAGADGGLDWVVPDADVEAEGASGTQDVDTALFGRRTYDMFESFWPRVLASGSLEDPHTPGRQSKQQRAFAVSLTAMTKLVFSRTRTEVHWKNARLAGELDPRAIEALKREPGKNIIVFGSGSLVSQLTQHGLIDEYHFIVSPLLLGDGKPLFTGLTRRVPLKLLEAKAYPSGNVSLRYERA